MLCLLFNMNHFTEYIEVIFAMVTVQILYLLLNKSRSFEERNLIMAEPDICFYESHYFYNLQFINYRIHS